LCFKEQNQKKGNLVASNILKILISSKVFYNFENKK
jgi:hypothetical protein